MADVLVGAPSRPKIQIVPVRGLPIVAVVIAGLVVTIATNKLWPLEFYHVVGGGMWTALDLFLGLVIGPIMAKMSVSARMEFSARFMPKMLLMLAAAAVLVLADVVLLARLREFAWPVFFQVAKWSLLAYSVMYGILEFTFVYDHVAGSTLVVLTLMLVVIAVDVPMLFGFSVARYAEVPEAPAT
jgi:hypothetical protein